MSRATDGALDLGILKEGVVCPLVRLIRLLLAPDQLGGDGKTLQVLGRLRVAEAGVRLRPVVPVVRATPRL